MNKQRKIINDKLNSIDHKLDVNQLWAQLETQLPPEQPRKRFAFWLWGGLMAVLLFGGIAWYSSDSTHPVDLSANTLPAAAEQQAGMQMAHMHDAVGLLDLDKSMGQEERLHSQKSNTSLQSSEQVGEGSVSDIATSEKIDIRSKGVAAYEDMVGGNIATSDKPEQRSNRVGSTPLMVPAAPRNTNQQVASSPSAVQNKSTTDLIKAILKRNEVSSVSPGEAQAAASKQESDPTRMNLSIAHLQQPIAELSFTRALLVGQAAAVPPQHILPVSKPSKWELGLVYNYGRSMANATYGDVDVSDVTEGASEAARGAEQIDVLGGEIKIGYGLTRTLGAAVGLSYQRATDQLVRSESVGTAIESLSDGSYQISNELRVATAYESSTIMDLQLGMNYSWRWAKFGIRPEVGLVLGLAHDRVTKSIDPNLELYKNSEGNIVRFGSASTAYRNRSSYYASLSASYDVGSRLALTAGVRFMPSRTFAGEESANLKYNSTLVGQAGVRYRF